MFTFMKIIAIIFMMLLIVLLLMIMGFIPSKKIIKFLQDKTIAQAVLGIAIMIGLCITFVVLSTA